jgi:hypothetical protein
MTHLELKFTLKKDFRSSRAVIHPTASQTVHGRLLSNTWVFRHQLAPATLIQGTNNINNLTINSTTRSFATKKIKAAGAKKKRTAAAVVAAKTDGQNEAEKKQAAMQHEQHWVKFQQSIAVDGFETGQTTMEVRTSNKKARGGKAKRKTQKS